MSCLYSAPEGSEDSGDRRVGGAGGQGEENCSGKGCFLAENIEAQDRAEGWGDTRKGYGLRAWVQIPPPSF